MKLLWIDLEMSGLDVTSCRILEAAALVSDIQLCELEAYEAIVYQPPEVLAAMDSWCTKQHGESGLTAAVANGRPERDVEDALLGIVDRHWKRDDRPILCGNSIHTDRRFIDAWWPRLASRLHYRMVDVSSFKVILRERYGIKVEKKGGHRALGDIRESISELQQYLSYLDLTRLGSGRS